MSLNKTPQHILFGWWPFVVIAVTTLAFIAIAIYCLSSGVFIIFQNFFYVPIIIACVYYTKRGFAFSIIIACIYFSLIAGFTRESSTLLEAFARVLIFILVAGIVTWLSSAQKRSEELLRQQHDHLEDLVQKRTAQLQEEITEHKLVEAKIQIALKEKDVLLNEIHHRVKNNMQVISGLLSLQAKASKNPKVIEKLNESNDRIRSMALVHEKLYNSKDFSKIDLSGYVRFLSQDLFQSHNINRGKIDMTIQADGEVYIDIIKAIPCGLIMNELISNALKHAFPGDRQGKLHICIVETKDRKIEIIVRDNGVGLPDDVDIHQPRSVGLHLVNGLVINQLDGQIEVKRNAGTEYRIKFNL